MEDQNLIQSIALPRGAFGRSGEIELRRKLTCGICGEKGCKGLSADSSEGEYSSCEICLECLKTVVVKLESA